jgi:CBS domain-containing protein
MRVDEVMTTNVPTCGPLETLSAAAQALWMGGLGCVAVVTRDDDAGPRLVGMVTDADVCRAAYAECRPLDRIRVASAMTTAVTACRAADPIDRALELMRRTGRHRLPVVDERDCLVGVIALADIARAATEATRGPAIGNVAEALAAVRGRWRGRRAA